MRQSGEQLMVLGRALAIGVVAAGLVAIGVGVYVNHQGNRNSVPTVTSRLLGLPPTGIDYYEPSSYYKRCPDWTWLQQRCWNPKLPITTGGEPGEQVLASDISFARSAGLGGLMRVWASGNQLFRLATDGRFAGLHSVRMRSLDQAMAVFHRNGIKVDLVLFTYSAGVNAVHQFNPMAIDGDHPRMRFAYLTALRHIVVHLARNHVDGETIRIIDLQNEPYYQLEQYFADPYHLGAGFVSCRTGSTVSSQCVDQRIIHPWLTALYRTASGASSRFLYTESDTGRLLATNRSQQRYWVGMYPADIYDIHMYDDQPWRDEARWATALNLQKPWFAGEVGCDSGNVGCTYSGKNAAPVDRWWLKNLGRYRAQSVLLESKTTIWYYRYATPSQTLTPTGVVLQCVTRPTRLGCEGIK